MPGFLLFGEGMRGGSDEGRADDVDGLGAVVDCVRDDTAVERGELAAVGYGEGEKVAVRDLAGGRETVVSESCLVEHADVVGPELVARIVDETRQQLGYDGRSAGRIGVSRISNNANESVFSERTSRPGLTAD